MEADETYVGGKERNRKRQDKQKKTGRGTNKIPVVVLVERGGEARSFRMANVTGLELKGAIRRNVARESRIMTDSFKSYRGLDKEFASHEYVSHSTASTCAATFTPTPRRTTSRSSSAGSTACITTSAKRTCPAISRSSTSATTTSRATA